MKSNSLRKLSADEYLAESKRWHNRFREYIDKKVDINKREHDDIEKVADDSVDYSDKVDIYFEKEKKKAKQYEKEREHLKEEYQRYTSIYETDFYTELTEEFLEKYSQYCEITSNTMKLLLEEIKNLKGKYFFSGKENKKYKCEFIAVQVDDLYYVGVSDDGEHCWYSCVVKPRFIE